MAILEIDNLDLSFGDKVLFKGANFVLNKFDKMGVVGVNGAGKSTLMKIIIGETMYDNGSLFINPKAKVGYLDQQALIQSDKDVLNYLRDSFKPLYDADNKLTKIYESMISITDEKEIISLTNQTEKIMEYLQVNDFYSIDAKVNKIALGLGITTFGMDTKVKTLSGGQREKVKLARLLLEKPDILLLDEPTNFLDVEQIHWLEDYLVNVDGTVMVISHDTEFLKKVANCICDIDLQKITRYNVDYNRYVKMKDLANAQQQRDYDSQQEKIENMQKLIDRFRYKATKASMVQSRIKVLAKMERVLPPTRHAKPIFTFKYKNLNSKILFEAKSLVIGYDKPLLKKPISFLLEKGEKLAITGFNGIGKSTFLKTISGIIPAISGTFKLATNTVIQYFEQDICFENDQITPLNYILEEYPKLTEKEARSALAKCGLRAEHMQEKIKQLSGGEQTKIKICKITLSPCNVLIFDEPTNHIDSFAIEQLSLAIRQFEGTVLFVSHDTNFINNTADKILSLEYLLN